MSYNKVCERPKNVTIKNSILEQQLAEIGMMPISENHPQMKQFIKYT